MLCTGLVELHWYFKYAGNETSTDSQDDSQDQPDHDQLGYLLLRQRWRSGTVVQKSPRINPCSNSPGAMGLPAKAMTTP